MQQKNCPICNRVLVQKSDQTQLCVFCGWSSTARKPKSSTQKVPANSIASSNKKQSQNKPKEKIITSAEEIARQQLKQENSKLQLWIASLAMLALFGLVIFQTCQPHTPESQPGRVVSPSAEPTSSPFSTDQNMSPSPAATFMAIPSPASVSPSPSPIEVPSPEPSASSTDMQSSTPVASESSALPMPSASASMATEASSSP